MSKNIKNDTNIINFRIHKKNRQKKIIKFIKILLFKISTLSINIIIYLKKFIFKKNLQKSKEVKAMQH